MANPFMKIPNPNEDRDRQQAEAQRLTHENMITRQMETQLGRMFVMHVLGKLGYMQNIVDTNASVYGKTAKQAVANDLAKEIKKVCPSEFLRMEQEAETIS
jgi:hypothetical protein